MCYTHHAFKQGSNTAIHRLVIWKACVSGLHVTTPLNQPCLLTPFREPPQPARCLEPLQTGSSVLVVIVERHISGGLSSTLRGTRSCIKPSRSSVSHIRLRAKAHSDGECDIPNLPASVGRGLSSADTASGSVAASSDGISFTSTGTTLVCDARHIGRRRLGDMCSDATLDKTESGEGGL